jgi:NAD(P)-dependent dehydrogenase (short-subunit alcohol dehydrogenase family)
VKTLADCTVLVTGASRGIGLATCRRLAARGCRVIGMARHEPDGGFPGEFFAVDLGDRAATATALGDIAAGYAVDGLVNNVGVNIVEPLDEVDLDHFDHVVDLNLRAAIQCAHAVLPGMRERGYGRIVNIASRAALGRRGRTSYTASKAGLIGMTRTWAIELAPHGITVNVVSPGATATEMFVRNNLMGEDADEVRRRFVTEIPMGRLGEPAEIAVAIEFFLSPDASFVTGQTLYVCGGSSLGSMSLL